ncbi:MAG: hypothetical protein HDS71_09730 [Bacteroidales bacterium]|nr:hypothetical protein [Bacteroidales bacterium]MBD5224303.1 hypothetical protein [Bacteroidales bacterium]
MYSINYRRISFLALLLLLVIPVIAQNPVTILDNSVAKLKNASGISCKFRITSDNNNLNGEFKSKGSSFYLETQAGKTWYNGVNMWTLNPGSKEITLVNPTSSEINEVNPFSYLSSYKSGYVVGFSKRKDSDRYLVVLNPKNGKKDNIKAIEVAINKKTMLPERFIIRDSHDRRTTVYITALATSYKSNSDMFVCPVGSFGDYELVDLR